MTAAFSRASHSSRIGGEAETKLSLISPDWISLDGKTWSIANPFFIADSTIQARPLPSVLPSGGRRHLIQTSCRSRAGQ